MDCTLYNKPETVKHGLTDCNRFTDERMELIAALEDGKQIITLGKLLEKSLLKICNLLINYLRVTGTMGKI